MHVHVQDRRPTRAILLNPPVAKIQPALLNQKKLTNILFYPVNFRSESHMTV